MNNKLNTTLEQWKEKMALQQSQAVKRAEKKQPANRKSGAASKASSGRNSKAPAAAPDTAIPSGPATGQNKQDWRTAKVQKPASAVPIGKQLKDVVDHLESSRKALTAEELREAVQHDVVGNKELYDVLFNNPKIRINPDGRYEYKPSHELQNVGEVLTLVSKHPHGVMAGQIKDAYKGVGADVKRLKEEGKVWCIHNASEKDDVLFPKDAKPLITLTQDLVDFWHATKVPEDPAHVIEELQKAKLPAAPRKVARKRVVLPPKESKKRKRAVNMATATNQHMPELFAGAMPVQID
ncbi:hypothetical protein WJX77_002507 [Trebouxia sp. C0004]